MNRIESLEKACHIRQVTRYVLEQQISRKRHVCVTTLCLWEEEEMSPIARCDIYIYIERIIAFALNTAVVTIH
jgi:hypothetical protein